MIEIILNKEQAENIFNFHIDANYSPKNNEIKKYCEFLVGHYRINDKRKLSNFLKSFYDPNVSISTDISLCENDGSITKYEYILFEFPDDYPEEELFYFKLKYC